MSSISLDSRRFCLHYDLLKLSVERLKFLDSPHLPKEDRDAIEMGSNCLRNKLHGEKFKLPLDAKVQKIFEKYIYRVVRAVIGELIEVKKSVYSNPLYQGLDQFTETPLSTETRQKIGAMNLEQRKAHAGLISDYSADRREADIDIPILEDWWANPEKIFTVDFSAPQHLG